jgi:hypothetical protein
MGMSSQKWRTSPWRFLFLSSAGGIISYHLLHQFYQLPYARDGLWIWECLTAAFGFSLGGVVNLVLHELSHASAVRLVRSPVYIVEIGLGPTVSTFSFLGFPFHIRSFPSSGIVRWGPNSTRFPRLQRAVVTFAGMFTTLIAFGLVLLVLHKMDLRNDVFSSARWFMAFWAGVTGSTILLLCGSWIPHHLKRDGRSIPTDALNLLRLPWLTHDYLYEQIRSTQITEEARKALDPSIKSVENALANAATHPKELKALFNACYHLHSKGDPRAMDFAQAALDLPTEGIVSRGIRIDFLITIGLDHGLLTTVPHGRALLEESFEEDRTGLGNLATYGAGLIDFNEDERGLKILEDVARRAKNPVNLAYTHLFLAIGKKKKNLTDEARNHAKKTADFYPQCPGLKRISDLLEPLSDKEKSDSR